MDVVYWFATGEAEWSNQDRAEWDSASRAKWAIATPMMLGQFPAAALMFRRGDVSTGEPAVVEHRSLEQIWERVPPIIAEDPGYDPNRDLGDSARRSHLAHGVDPLAFLVGPVEVVYGSDPARTKVADLSRSIDQKARVVRSNTGQLVMGLRPGPVHRRMPRRPRAPPASSVGSARSRWATSRSDRRTIMRRSSPSRSMVEAAGPQRPHPDPGGHPRPADGLGRPRGHLPRRRRQADHPRPADRLDRHDALGHRRGTKATIQVRNPNLTKAIPLDANGNPRGTTPVRRTGGAIELELPGDALYVVLSAQ